MTASTRKVLVYSRLSPAGIKIAVKPGLSKTQVKKNHIVCKVICAGLNPVDAKYLVGDKLPQFVDDIVGRRSVEGLGVGFDFSGVVMAVPKGEEDGDYKLGDFVYGTTGIGTASVADECVVPLHQVCHMPHSLTFAEASCLPLVGLTALQAFRPYFDEKKKSSRCNEEKNVLIIGGSGGVGHVAMQVIKCLGDSSSSSPVKSLSVICGPTGYDMVNEYGNPDHIIDYVNDDVMKKLEEIVKYNDGPFHFCFDTVTSRNVADDKYKSKILSTVAESSRDVELFRGDYVTIGGTFFDWVRAGIKRIIGFNLFRRGEELFWIKFPYSSCDLIELKQFAENKSMKPHVSREIPFEDIEAIRKGINDLIGRRVKGKLVVRINPDPAT